MQLASSSFLPPIIAQGSDDAKQGEWSGGKRRSFLSGLRTSGLVAAESKLCSLDIHGRFAVGVDVNGLLLLPSRSNLILALRYSDLARRPSA